MVSKFSEKEWAKIVAGAKCPHEFATDSPYDDKILYDIVAAASKAPRPSVPISTTSSRTPPRVGHFCCIPADDWWCAW